MQPSVVTNTRVRINDPGSKHHGKTGTLHSMKLGRGYVQLSIHECVAVSLDRIVPETTKGETPNVRE